MKKTKWLKCEGCGVMFEYSGVGRPPRLCPDCRAKAGREEIVGTEERDGVTYYKVARYNKEGKQTGFYYIRKDEA